MFFFSIHLRMSRGRERKKRCARSALARSATRSQTARSDKSRREWLLVDDDKEKENALVPQRTLRMRRDSLARATNEKKSKVPLMELNSGLFPPFFFGPRLDLDLYLLDLSFSQFVSLSP